MLMSQPTHTPLVFFSLRLADPSWRLLTDHALALRKALRTARRLRPFDVDSIVVLPSALHTIWALPEGDTALTPRVTLLRAGFARAVSAKTGMAPDAIWQDHLVPHHIDTAENVDAWRDMVHSAPIGQGAGLAGDAWRFHSAHRGRVA